MTGINTLLMERRVFPFRAQQHTLYPFSSFRRRRNIQTEKLDILSFSTCAKELPDSSTYGTF